jgi:hypothetical protein
MKAATGKDIAEHVMRPAKVIPARLFPVGDAHCQSVYLAFGGIE